VGLWAIRTEKECHEETSPVAGDCAARTAIGVHAFGRRHVAGVLIKV